MKKAIALTVAAVMVLSALTGCGAGNSKTATTATEQTKAAALDKLTVTYVTSPLNIPSIVEKDQQIFSKAFADAGTEIAYAEITSGADQTQALASGDVQILYAVGATSVILSASNGADIKVLNMYGRSPKAFCLYSREEEFSSPESLRGKTIAGPAGTNLHELLAAYLATADMTVEDVNYVNMSIPDAKAGLDGGSVDVAMVAGAAAYTAQQQGYHLVADGEGLIDAIIAVAVTEKFYNEHKDVIDTFNKAQAEIAEFIQNHNEETLSITAKALDLEEAAVRDMAQLYNFSNEITEADLAGFQKTADFMFSADMIEKEVNVSDLMLP